MKSAKTLTILRGCCICLAVSTTAWADFVGVVSENAKRAAPTFGTVGDAGRAPRPASGGAGCGDGICHCEESCGTCPEDCGTCGGCGNGVCDEDDGGCPASNCVNGAITHSQSMEIVVGAGMACGGGGTTTPNAWARCFNLEDEGFVGDVTITCVDFGTESSLPFDVPVFANIYLTTLGCPASGFGTPDTVLIAIAETVAGPADAGVVINAEFGIPVEVAAGSTIIVEIEVLADGGVEGFGLFPGANSDGQCCVTSLRAAACGMPDWRDVAALGFSDFHLALRANVFTGECTVPALGGGENCDDCPQDCGPCTNCGGCPTDSTGDGNTGAADLAALLACWGPAVAACECFDASNNGIIDPFDLATLLANWGPCP